MNEGFAPLSNVFKCILKQKYSKFNCFCRPLAPHARRPRQSLSQHSALGGIVKDLHLAQLRVQAATVLPLDEDVACGARMRQHL